MQCMEDEVDYSFLTQAEYEEALIDEQITEEAVYQVDGQVGYQLRSRLVAPLKKNAVHVKKPATSSRKIDVLPKKVDVTSKALQKLAPSAIPDQAQLMR